MKYKTIVFDYDGTLHETISIYYPAFLKANQYLVEHGYQPKKEWTPKMVSRFIGMSPTEMWQTFKPSIPNDIIEIVTKIVGQAMVEAIDQGHAKLYDGALDVLKTLKEHGYYLIYLSNSRTYYMEKHKEYFKLDAYFDEFHVSEQYNFIPKKEILKSFINRLPKPVLMVGDRIHDIETGIENHIDTVGCMYGYGIHEIKDSTFKIQNIKELLNLI